MFDQPPENPPQQATPRVPRVTARIAGRALHPLLRPFAVGYFLATLACDLIYAQSSANARYLAQDFGEITEWLLVAGLIMAALCAAVALVDWMGEQAFRELPDLAWYAGGTALAIALQLYNLGVRASGGSEAIKPTGLLLSLAAVAVLLATPARDWFRLYRTAR